MIVRKFELFLARQIDRLRERERGRERGRGKRAKQGATAVTLRLVFLITRDPGRAEEEERSFLSDVSIMTRLRAVYTRTGRRVGSSLGASLGAIPAQGTR